MRWSTLTTLAVLHATGCLAKPDRPSDRDAPAAIDAAADAAPPPCVGILETLAHPANADAALLSATPDLPAGTMTVANVGVDIGSRGLFRFVVTGVVGADVKAMRLVLRYAIAQEDCGTACGSCDGIDRAGDLVAYAAVSSWSEPQVTWNERAAGVPWGLPGADQPGTPDGADRGVVATTASHPHAQDTSFVLDANAVAEALGWIEPATGRLSFVIVPLAPAVLVATTHEGVITPCVPNDRAAMLEVDVCR